MDQNMQKLMENEELVKGMVDAKTPEELVDVMKANGVELEEGLTPEAAFEKAQAAKSGELGEDDLENVNGGIGILLGVTAAGLMAVGGWGITFLVSYGVQKYKNGRKR